MRIPVSLAAGDALAWREQPFVAPDGRSIGPSQYSLSFAVRGPVADAGLDLVADASWSFAISSAQSAALNTGSSTLIWFWQAFATDGAGARSMVGDGRLTVRPNLATLSGTAFDGRSQAERNLATVRAAIQSRIDGNLVTRYSIGSRSLEREPMTELLALETRLAQQVARERTAANIANGLGNPGKAYVRFSGGGR